MPSWTSPLADGYRLQLSMVLSSQNVSGNYSVINWSLAILKGSGSGKWADGPHTWARNVNGIARTGSIASYDFRNYSTLVLTSGVQNIPHNADGTKTVSGSGSFNDNNTWGELGDASVSGSMALPRINRLPGPTRAPSSGANPDQITATSMRYRFQGPSDNGGSSIQQYQAQRATNSGFTTGVVTVTSSGTTTFTGLTPNTTYYFRSRARNAVGWGPYGASDSGKTLEASAPTIQVSPYATGLSATVKVIPPPAVTSWTETAVQRRVTGTTTVADEYQFTGTTTVVPSLTPGASYDWRAAYWIGNNLSAWSSWVTVVQPAPNTNPGDYFDGNTTGKPGITFSWNGTANSDTSKGTATIPTGWGQTVETPAGEAFLYRQGGGRSQSYAARLVFTALAGGAGRGAGLANNADGRVPVAPGGVYWGSIHVQIPFRAQNMRARLRWLTSAGAIISDELGTPVWIDKYAASWTRLAVSGTAPDTAAFAIVQAIDVDDGVNWTLWESADVLLLDDAMLTIGAQYPYFDGSTKDTAQYDYAWTGTANASPSTRTTLEQFVDPFADPDCDPIPAPPRPPLVDTDCITEVGTWRRYWITITPQNILNWIADLPTITLTTAGAAARQIRIRTYENPLGLAPENFVALNDWDAEQIISYMPANSTYVLNGVDETMTGTLDAGLTWTNLNHLLYGTNSTPASWPVLRCGYGYLISLDVPTDAPPENLTTDIELTRRF